MIAEFRSKKIIHHDPPSFTFTDKDIPITKFQVDIAAVWKNKMPIIFTWRSNILENGKTEFSFIVVYNFFLEFTKGESPIEKLKKLINYSHDVFINDLCTTALKIDIGGFPAIPFDKDIVSNKAREIEDIAKNLLLL